jgi:hypothetical protein
MGFLLGVLPAAKEKSGTKKSREKPKPKFSARLTAALGAAPNETLPPSLRSSRCMRVVLPELPAGCTSSGPETESVGTTRRRVIFFMKMFRESGLINFGKGDDPHIHSSLLRIVRNGDCGDVTPRNAHALDSPRQLGKRSESRTNEPRLFLP